jgi:hypothetical protein
MHTHIHAGMGLAIFRGGLRPRTGHHDGAGGNAAELPQVGVSLDGGLAHADIIGVDYDETVGVRKAKFLEDRIWVHGFLSSDLIPLPVERDRGEIT